MKLKLSLRNPSTNEFFVEEVVFQSKLLTDPSIMARALRVLYESEAPEIDILCVTSVVELEVGSYS